MRAPLALWLALLSSSLAPSTAWGQGLGHPPIALRDAEGQSVLASQRPVSTHQSCAPCHEVQAIAAGYHAQLGLGEGDAPRTRQERGDAGPGLWGRWDPRLGAPPERDAGDLGARLRDLASRHVGGGPGLPAGLEVDCFLCHTARPNWGERLQTVASGRFAEAPSATLLGSGLLERAPAGLRWLPEGFTPEGLARPELLGLKPPQSERCLACHGLAASPGEPMWTALPAGPAALGDEGFVFSAQRVADSAFNLRDKDRQTQPWDVHAERLLSCSDCHPPLNAPAGFREGEATRPAHLADSPRAPSAAEFLRSPSHDFRKGRASQGTAARRLSGSMRSCRDCHAQAQHEAWLPRASQHLARLSCQACHIPSVRLPARRATDWSVPSPEGAARVEYRGARGPLSAPETLLEPWEPLLLPRDEGEAGERLQPTNLQAAFYWVGGQPPAPVPLARLRAALHQEGAFRPEVLASLDRDGDGALSSAERWLETPAQVELVAGLLRGVGVESPRLTGELLAQELHHGVVSGPRVLRDCRACHSPAGRLGSEWLLAERAPAGVLPALVGDAQVQLPGQLRRVEGRLSYRAAPAAGAHVFGRTRRPWIDRLGIGLLALALLGALGHGGLRALTRKSP